MIFEGIERSRDIPIMTVSADTITVVGQVEDMMSRLRIRDERKISRAIELVNEELDFWLENSWHP